MILGHKTFQHLMFIDSDTAYRDKKNLTHMIRIFLSHYVVMMGIVMSAVHVVRHLNRNSEG
jgi:hypothetical protein